MYGIHTTYTCEIISPKENKYGNFNPTYSIDNCFLFIILFPRQGNLVRSKVCYFKFPRCFWSYSVTLENKKVKEKPCILKKLSSQNILRKESNHIMNVTSCAILKIVNNHKIKQNYFYSIFFSPIMSQTNIIFIIISSNSLDVSSSKGSP